VLYQIASPGGDMRVGWGTVLSLAVMAGLNAHAESTAPRSGEITNLQITAVKCETDVVRDVAALRVYKRHRGWFTFKQNAVRSEMLIVTPYVAGKDSDGDLLCSLLETLRASAELRADVSYYQPDSASSPLAVFVTGLRIHSDERGAWIGVDIQGVPDAIKNTYIAIPYDSYESDDPYAQVLVGSRKAPASTKELCSFKDEDFKALLSSAENRIAFSNDGGILNGGVCWWHSRFQRLATYLTVFPCPDCQKPNEFLARQYIQAIAGAKRVVEIPGYRNLQEFTKDHEKVLQEYLNAWQLTDGIFGGQWFNGLTGHSSLPADKMRAQVEKLYSSFVTSGEVLYLKMQLPGIDAHALLLFDISPWGEINGAGVLEQLGYEMLFIDSNSLDTVRYRYRFGDTNVSGGVPYEQRDEELEKAKDVLSRFCS
jgi:hypothetical protein